MKKIHRKILFRLLIILIPSYFVAFLTDKMVYVVPTLAASLAIMAMFEKSNEDREPRVDEEAESGFEFDGN